MNKRIRDEVVDLLNTLTKEDTVTNHVWDRIPFMTHLSLMTIVKCTVPERRTLLTVCTVFLHEKFGL